jgi:hypothetical protein
MQTKQIEISMTKWEIPTITIQELIDKLEEAKKEWFTEIKQVGSWYKSSPYSNYFLFILKKEWTDKQ